MYVSQHVNISCHFIVLIDEWLNIFHSFINFFKFVLCLYYTCETVLKIAATMKLFEVRLHGMTSSDENSEVERLLQAVSDLFTSTTKMKFQLPLYLLFKTPTWKLFGNAEGYIHE